MARMNAEPYEFEFSLDKTALVMIDFQRDFVYPGGFGESLGNDVSLLLAAVGPAELVLKAAREAGMFVVHTREGHRADLSDLPDSKRDRGDAPLKIGDQGSMGRLLVRGEYGHGIVDELAPIAGEPVVDKPGKGAFYATDMDTILRMRGIEKLIFTGVTTEVCVTTSVREANDRGFDAVVLEDCVGSYFPEFQSSALAMIKAQGGIFGWVGQSQQFLTALEDAVREGAGRTGVAS